jgi:uncharacterized membrane protein
MIADSALPGIWILIALAAIVALMTLCTSCATSGAFEFMNEYGRIKYEPVTGAIEVEYHASK